MYLDDPRGSINCTNQQLLDFVSNLLAAIAGNPASSTLSAVLTEQQKSLIHMPVTRRSIRTIPRLPSTNAIAMYWQP